DFGRLAEGGPSPHRTVRLGNAGGGTLNARATTSASWFRLQQVGDELIVTVDTTAVGDHEGGGGVESDRCEGRRGGQGRREGAARGGGWGWGGRHVGSISVGWPRAAHRLTGRSASATLVVGRSTRGRRRRRAGSGCSRWVTS